MPVARKSVTLIELLIAVALVFMVVVGLGNMEIFGRQHLIGSSRRALLQNELSGALEEMTKYSIQATGDFAKGKPPLQILNAGTNNNGIRIRTDLNNPVTPANADDDLWYIYTLNDNTLSFSCTKVDGTSSGMCPASRILSTRILTGVAPNQIMSTTNPTSGFYINLSNNNTAAEVGLVGRFDPSSSIASQNPQVQMKARLQTSNVSAN